MSITLNSHNWQTTEQLNQLIYAINERIDFMRTLFKSLADVNSGQPIDDYVFLAFRAFPHPDPLEPFIPGDMITAHRMEQIQNYAQYVAYWYSRHYENGTATVGRFTFRDVAWLYYFHPSLSAKYPEQYSFDISNIGHSIENIPDIISTRSAVLKTNDNVFSELQYGGADFRAFPTSPNEHVTRKAKAGDCITAEIINDLVSLVDGARVFPFLHQQSLYASNNGGLWNLRMYEGHDVHWRGQTVHQETWHDLLGLVYSGPPKESTFTFTDSSGITFATTYAFPMFEY